MDRSLSRAAQKRIDHLANRTPLPNWFQPFSVLLLGVFFAYLMVQVMIAPTHSAHSASAPVPTIPLTTPTTVAPPSTSIPTGTHVATVAVENAQQSGSVTVPLAAVNMAKRVAIAEVTGVSAGLAVAPGSAPVPGAAVPYPGAAIQSVQVNQYSGSSYSFLVTVSTGTLGRTGVFAVGVTVIHGQWRYSSSVS